MDKKMNKKESVLKRNESSWAILSLINNAKENQKQVLGWRLVAGKKVTADLYIRVVRKFRNEFVVRASGQRDREKLSDLLASNGVLNFFLVDDMSLFQTKLKSSDSNGDYVFTVPDMIAHIERRGHIRLNPEDKFDIKCTFQKRAAQSSMGQQQFTKECFDISAGGLSFFISRAEAKYFQMQDSVELIEINFEGRAIKVRGKIVNIFDVEPDERNGLNYKAKKVCIQYYEIRPDAQKLLNDFVFSNSDIDEAV